MLFSSISFIYYFLPMFFIVYFSVPWRFKNLTLLIFSLLFYFIGEPIYILILLISSLVDYVNGLLIEKYRGFRKAKYFLLCSLMLNIGILGVFKYSDFFMENMNKVFDTGIIPWGIALPLGISFYTFQTMSYTIDVYRGEVKAQTNFLNYATYVCMFPQLVAGPIVRYKTIGAQMESRTHSLADFSYGISRFIIGLSKKVIIANSLGELSELAYGASETSVLMYWLGATGFMLQIYFDFSGYSDMAIGIGRMLGFKYLENFNYPFVAKSLTDFWRRWHMSLGSWLRDYIYIPMGGSKVPALIWVRNIAVVWFLTGFWHGANWNFVIWGILFGTFLVMEKLFLIKFLNKFPLLISRVYTLLFLLISFTLFNTSDLTLLGGRIGGLFGIGVVDLVSPMSFYYFKSYSILFVLAMAGSLPIGGEIFNKLLSGKEENPIIGISISFILATMLIISTSYIVDSSFNPFLYFRF